MRTKKPNTNFEHQSLFSMGSEHIFGYEIVCFNVLSFAQMYFFLASHLFIHANKSQLW